MESGFPDIRAAELSRIFFESGGDHGPWMRFDFSQIVYGFSFVTVHFPFYHSTHSTSIPTGRRVGGTRTRDFELVIEEGELINSYVNFPENFLRFSITLCDWSRSRWNQGTKV